MLHTHLKLCIDVVLMERQISLCCAWKDKVFRPNFQLGWVGGLLAHKSVLCNYNFYITFAKEKNFHDFLFLPWMLREKISWVMKPQGSKFIPLRVDPFWKGRQNKMTEFLPWKVYWFTLKRE